MIHQVPVEGRHPSECERLNNLLLVGHGFTKRGKSWYGASKSRHVWCSDDLQTIYWGEDGRGKVKGELDVSNLKGVLESDDAVARGDAVDLGSCGDGPSSDKKKKKKKKGDAGQVKGQRRTGLVTRRCVCVCVCVCVCEGVGWGG